MAKIEIPETLIGRILKPFLATPLRYPVRLVLSLQLWLWRRKPGLVERLSNFLPIDGTGSVVQIILLAGLIWAGSNTFLATVAALMAGSLVSFTGNRFITWQNRFALLSRRQQVMWFTPLFLIFSSTIPTMWMKLVGINSLEHFLGVHVFVSWLALTFVGVVANYLGADLIAFGVIAKTINAISGSSKGEETR